MKIGELASATRTSVEAIRHYEREGLITAPARSDANYRVYGAGDVERLQFIRHCRSLDMALPEIRALLRVKDDPAGDCGDVDDLLDAHIGHVVARIRELRLLERQLKALRALCPRPDAAADCGILRHLTDGAAPASRPAGTASHVGGPHGARR